MVKQEQNPIVNTGYKEMVVNGSSAVMPDARPEKSMTSQETTLFVNELNQGGSQGVSSDQSLEITKQAEAKIKALQDSGMLSPKVAESLLSKLGADGSGLMGKVKPEAVLATLKAVEELAKKGFGAEAIKAITTVGFGKGGIAGIDKYLGELKTVTPEKLKEHIQENNSHSVLWLKNHTGIFDDATLKYIDVEAMIRAAKAKLQEVASTFMPNVMNVVNSTVSTLKTGYDALLSFISKGEGGYNSMNQGTSGGQIVGSTHDASTILGKDLTNMTIGEVMALQSSGKLFAAGRYQIIPSTMQEVMRYSGLSANDAFSPENQDRLAIALIKHKRPDLGAYLDGKHNDLRLAMKEFAREWASVPDPDTGASYYGGGNAALHSVDEVKSALLAARSRVTDGSVLV
jgi:muramidase (phage lysozyme)